MSKEGNNNHLLPSLLNPRNTGGDLDMSKSRVSSSVIMEGLRTIDQNQAYTRNNINPSKYPKTLDRIPYETNNSSGLEGNADKGGVQIKLKRISGALNNNATFSKYQPNTSTQMQTYSKLSEIKSQRTNQIPSTRDVINEYQPLPSAMSRSSLEYQSMDLPLIMKR